MLLTILKSFMWWKYRWIDIYLEDGTRLHGIVTDSAVKGFKETFLNTYDKKN